MELPAVGSLVSPEPIELIDGSLDEVQDRVAQSRGRIVVLDLWSTSCPPCIQELPHLGTLQQAHPDDVVGISVSVDYAGIKSRPPEFYRERVLKVLEFCEAHLVNYLCTTEADDVFRELGLSSIPVVYVYGKDGQLVQRFDASLLNENSEDEEPFTYENDVIPLVQKLIAAQR